MKKYIYIFIFIPFLFLGCDYAPIYSKKNDYNFKIEKIEFSGDAEVNNLIDKKLKKYKKKTSDKKFDIFTKACCDACNPVICDCNSVTKAAKSASDMSAISFEICMFL